MEQTQAKVDDLKKQLDLVDDANLVKVFFLFKFNFHSFFVVSDAF